MAFEMFNKKQDEDFVLQMYLPTTRLSKSLTDPLLT